MDVGIMHVAQIILRYLSLRQSAPIIRPVETSEITKQDKARFLKRTLEYSVKAAAGQHCSMA